MNLKALTILLMVNFTVGCVTSDNYRSTDREQNYFITCSENYSAAQPTLRLIVCEAENRKNQVLPLNFESASVKPTGKILNLEETQKLSSTKQGDNDSLTPGNLGLLSFGAVASTGNSQDGRGAAVALVVVGGFAIIKHLHDNAPGENEEEKMPHLLMGHSSIDAGASEKRYVLVRMDETPGSLDSLTLCMADPSVECVDVRVKRDPIGVRARPGS